MIAAADYASLVAARRTLTETADALRDAIHEYPSAVEASDMTHVAVLCEQAENAIFEALNTAGHHLNDAESIAALFPDHPS